MQYPLYQQAGWPIGSGTVESANKLVMQTRLKGPGMRWAPAHVNPMLALRTVVCNNRWDEAWGEVMQEHHRLHALKRDGLALPRLRSLVSSWLLLLLQFRPPTPKPPPPSLPRPVLPAATLPGSSRPSPITSGNALLLAALSCLQKCDGHPLLYWLLGLSVPEAGAVDDHCESFPNVFRLDHSDKLKL